jgi:hypothetical protein
LIPDINETLNIFGKKFDWVKGQHSLFVKKGFVYDLFYDRKNWHYERVFWLAVLDVNSTRKDLPYSASTNQRKIKLLILPAIVFLFCNLSM